MQHNHSQDSVDYFDEIQLLNIHLKQNLIDVKFNLAFKHEHKPVWEPLYEQYFEKKQIKRSFCKNSKQISQPPFYDVLTPIRRNEIFAFTKNRCGYYK